MFAIGVTIGALVGIFIMCLLQINRENKECLHCGKGAARYCESCFQDLCVENLKQQAKLREYEHCIKVNTIKLNKIYGKYKDTDSIEKHIPRLD